ncbi:T-cell surface glycoprotein YE1/48 [Lemmus lemmus]
MRNQQVTYSTSRDFEFSSESQNTASPDETQGSREAGHKDCSISLLLIAVTLGILCLLLLMAITLLLILVFQYSEKNQNLQKTLNDLTQQYHTLQSTNSLMKEMLKNKSREFDDLKRQSREQNRCCRETKVLDCIQLTGKYVDGYWFCSPIKCYFIMDNKQWSGCKKTCQDCSLSLLKIEDDDELKFIQVKVKPNNYWIGLSYVARKKKWQ